MFVFYFLNEKVMNIVALSQIKSELYAQYSKKYIAFLEEKGILIDGKSYNTFFKGCT